MKLTRENKLGRNAAAFTLIELLVVIVIIVILAALLLPGGGPKKKGKIVWCLSNLKQVGLGFSMWAGDNGGKYPMQVSVTNGGTMEYVSSGMAYVHFLRLSNIVVRPSVFVCPVDKDRTAANDFNRGFGNNNVSYFIALETATNQPASTILSGDRNLTIDGAIPQRFLMEITSNNLVSWSKDFHPNGGCLVFADGHAEFCRTNAITQKFQATGLATNRLVLP